MKNPLAIHTLETPGGRTFQLSIAPDGTRVVAMHLHKRELLSLSVACDHARERAMEFGNCIEQREFQLLRDMFLKALHHES